MSGARLGGDRGTRGERGGAAGFSGLRAQRAVRLKRASPSEPWSGSAGVPKTSEGAGAFGRDWPSGLEWSRRKRKSLGLVLVEQLVKLRTSCPECVLVKEFEWRLRAKFLKPPFRVEKGSDVLP